MSKKTDDKISVPALATGYKSFIIPVNNDALAQLPEEVVAEIPDDDNEFYESPRGGLPFVAIRQKDFKDEKGNLVYPAGGFKYQNVDMEVPDADGVTGLAVSIIADQASRVYWRNLTDDRPSCKSIDGKVGAGDPGGKCEVCPLAQWGADGKAPECSAQMNLFCFDHSIGGTYVVSLGRSALKPYNTYKNILKRNKVRSARGLVSVPMAFVKTLISTEYRQEPAGHYVPAFRILESLNLEMVRMVKNIRDEYAEVFRKVAAELDIKHETENGATPPIDTTFDDAFDDLPSRSNKDDDELPY